MSVQTWEQKAAKITKKLNSLKIKGQVIVAFDEPYVRGEGEEDYVHDCKLIKKAGLKINPAETIEPGLFYKNYQICLIVD